MLLAVPILILAAPLLLMGFFAANNLAGAILGPPAIWERPSSIPAHLDIVGDYHETRRTAAQAEVNRASLSLKDDRTMVVDELPYEFYPKTCTLSGTGRWSGPDGEDQQIYLVITSKERPGVYVPGEYAGLEITGRSKPYGLYWVIGDPDSGE
jgi:hypothetical protein